MVRASIPKTVAESVWFPRRPVAKSCPPRHVGFQQAAFQMLPADAVVVDRGQYLMGEPVPAFRSPRTAPDAIWEGGPNLIQDALGQLEIFRFKDVVRNEHGERSSTENLSVRRFCAVGNPSTEVNTAFAAEELPV